MLMVFTLVMLVQAGAAPPAATFDASRATISPPQAVLEVDAGKLKGAPVLLAMADDGRIFLRTAETDRFGNERRKNYVAASPKSPWVQVDEQPAWAAMYWIWKSGTAAPGLPTLKFHIETREKGTLATGSTSQADGVDNPYRADPSSNQVAHDTASYQKVVTTTVTLKGQLVFEGQNKPFAPGVSFGWAPPPMGALAFADAKKRLVVVDRDGHRKDVDGAVDVLLPGWTADGRHIFYLQKSGGKKYSLMMVDVR